MRTLLKVSIPVEKGNEAATSGALPRTIQELMEKLQRRPRTSTRRTVCGRPSSSSTWRARTSSRPRSSRCSGT